MRTLSLFSGGGLLDYGLHRAGFTPAGFAETDPFARRILARHWPGVPILTDIRHLTQQVVRLFGEVDAIVGGPPCQPVSYAGKQLGADDPRWLWPEFLDAVRLVRPRIVIAENPPGVIDAGWSYILGRLAALGYDAEWTVLPAIAFGAAHIRERVFLVAQRAGEWRPVFDPRLWRGMLTLEVRDGKPWPTPQAHDAIGARGRNNTFSDHHYYAHDLVTAVQPWPTPTAHEGGTAIGGRHGGGNFADQLPNVISGQLNPDWVENLQGVPIGWTIPEGPSLVDEPPLPDPAWRGEEQYDFEPPRTVQGPVPDRAGRLRALGNGVYERAAEALGRAILQSQEVIP